MSTLVEGQIERLMLYAQIDFWRNLKQLSEVDTSLNMRTSPMPGAVGLDALLCKSISERLSIVAERAQKD